MAEQARVTSIDALEAFRSAIIIFVTRAHRSLDEVGDEVRRTRGWLQNDMRLLWEGEVRKRGKKLEQAQSELMSARLSGLRDSTSAQDAAVLRAKRALAEAEEKLKKVKAWTRDYDHHVEPLAKRLEGLRQFLNYDMPKAIAYLVQAQRTLEAYSESGPPPGALPAAAAPEPNADQSPAV